jgi:hypothetical protein
MSLRKVPAPTLRSQTPSHYPRLKAKRWAPGVRVLFFLPGLSCLLHFCPRRPRTAEQDMPPALGGRSPCASSALRGAARLLRGCHGQDADPQHKSLGRSPPSFPSVPSVPARPFPAPRGPGPPQPRRRRAALPARHFARNFGPLPGARERDVNEGAWPGAVSHSAPELRLAEARRKDDVMQRRGGAARRGPRLLPLGLVCLCLALGRVRLDSIGKACKSLLF